MRELDLLGKEIQMSYAPAGTADYILSVNLMGALKEGYQFGSFMCYRKLAGFGVADEVMRFCPTDFCTGVQESSIRIEEEDARLVGDIKDLSTWPEHLIQKYYVRHLGARKCTVCHQESLFKDWMDTYYFNTSTKQVAKRMVELFFNLKASADIHLVRVKSQNALTKAMQESYKEGRSSFNKQMSKHDNSVEQSRFLLKNIWKDQSELHTKFEAMLRA